jgi:hypothetical protein
LNFRQRVLYHQIHPLKLATDWLSAAISTALLWQHLLVRALLVGLVPPVLVSAALITWAKLEPLERSRFGRHVARHMTRAMEGVRLLGLVVLWVGAWAHRAWLQVGGAVPSWERRRVLREAGDDGERGTTGIVRALIIRGRF